MIVLTRIIIWLNIELVHMSILFFLTLYLQSLKLTSQMKKFSFLVQQCDGFCFYIILFFDLGKGEKLFWLIIVRKYHCLLQMGNLVRDLLILSIMLAFYHKNYYLSSKNKHNKLDSVKTIQRVKKCYSKSKLNSIF